MDSTDHRTAIARGQDVFLNTHQNLSLSTCFFRLNNVKVHLITIEISVVRGTYCEVESERMSFHNTYFVNHHRHSVKRWLSVKDCNVSIDKVTLYLHTWLWISTDVNG